MTTLPVGACFRVDANFPEGNCIVTLQMCLKTMLPIQVWPFEKGSYESHVNQGIMIINPGIYMWLKPCHFYIFVTTHAWEWFIYTTYFPGETGDCLLLFYQHYQPLLTVITHYQPLSTIINNYQPLLGMVLPTFVVFFSLVGLP